MGYNRHLMHGRVTQAAPEAIETQDVVVSGIGVPNMALVLSSGATAIDTEAAGMAPMIGFMNPSKQCFAGSSHRDDNAPVRAYSQASIAGVVNQLEPQTDGTLLTRGVYSDRVTDGFELNFTVGNAGAHLYSSILMRDGVQDMDIAEFTLPASGSVSVSMAFEPDVILFLSAGNATTNKDNSGTLGLAAGIPQGAVGAAMLSAGYREQFANNTSNAKSTMRDNDTAIASMEPNSSTVNTFSAGLFSASGFTAAREEGSTEMLVTAVGIKLQPGYEAAIGQINTPTETGRHTLGREELAPEFVLLFGAGVAADNTDEDGIGVSIGVSGGMANQTCVSGGTMPVATPKPAKSRHSDSEIIRVHRDPDQKPQAVAALEGLTADGGMMLNFTEANESVRMIYLMIGRQSARAISKKPVKRKSTSVDILKRAYDGPRERVADYEFGGRNFYQKDNPT